MADVFLSYAREDREAAARLARLLEEQGFTVWWDRSIPAGRKFDEIMGEAIASASAVLVLWSGHSVNSRWVLREAEEAVTQGKLVQVLVEQVEPPHPFQSHQPVDLSKWGIRGRSGSIREELERLKTAVRSHIKPRKIVRVVRPPGARAGEKHYTPIAKDRIKVAVNSPRSLGPACEIVRAYLYSESDESKVRKDASRLRVGAKAQHASAATTISQIQVGTPITVVIHLPAAECRRTQQRFIWRGRWHKTDFEVSYVGPPVSEPQTGSVSWFAGMVCIGQLAFSIGFTNEKKPPDIDSMRMAPGYEAVFVSYSTKDSAIVDWLEATYTALGMTYLRDVSALRSGETWDKQLLTLIERADLFQLCWSANAKQSQYVTDEWRFALGLQRPNFIRPCCWEDPIPEPPPELQRLHFARLKLSRLMRTWLRLRARFR